jgi:hypothetical protein
MEVSCTRQELVRDHRNRPMCFFSIVSEAWILQRRVVSLTAMRNQKASRHAPGSSSGTLDTSTAPTGSPRWQKPLLRRTG